MVMLRGCLKSPDSVKFGDFNRSFQLPNTWAESYARTLSVEISGLFKHPLTPVRCSGGTLASSALGWRSQRRGRNNDDPTLPWHGPTIFGQELGIVASVSFIERRFGKPGNLEIVVGVGTTIDFFWRDFGPAFVRNGPTPIAADGISPVLIQSRFGAIGNFELLAIEPAFSPSGGIVHYS